MRIFSKFLAATAALTVAAPAAAQYYGYNYNSYGYANTNMASSQCSAAVQNRLYNRTSIGGSWVLSWATIQPVEWCR